MCENLDMIRVDSFRDNLRRGATEAYKGYSRQIPEGACPYHAGTSHILVLVTLG